MIANNEFCGYDPIIDLPFAMDGLTIDQATGELYFPKPELTRSTVYFVRSLSEMHDIYHDDELLQKGIVSSQKTVHRIYRTIGDTEEIVKSDLKYDITVILPGDWDRQLPTTTGHYHLPIEGNSSTIPSPDFYQLISGNVMAILQRETEKGTEVLILQPKIGDWVLIPGEYAHSVVNIGKKPAVFANVCVRTPHLNYKPILERRGMGVYVTRNDSDGSIEIVRNRNYEKIAFVAMGQSQPNIPNLIIDKQSLFELLNSHLDDLRFLTAPDSMPQIFIPDPIQVTQFLYKT